MQFPTLTSPYSIRPNRVAESMQWVLLALLPGTAAMWYYFGWGILINILIAVVTAVACEAFALRLRKRSMQPLFDYSAVVTGILLALTIPPLMPWWLTALGVAFAILLVKHMYGGLGYNVFNPAMAGYVFLLISYPVYLTAWLPPSVLQEVPLSFFETAQIIFSGVLPANTSWDAITMATPLDIMRTELDRNLTFTEIRQNPLWGDYGAKGWEWVGNWFLLGGIILLYKRVISWHIPIAMIFGLMFTASVFYTIDADAYPFGLFHIFSGGTLLAAFFIATDPITACTTKKGQLIYGASIGFIVYIIRTWGGYPDGVAFAVLLLNMAAPTIDHYTQPRVYGHAKDQAGDP